MFGNLFDEDFSFLSNNQCGKQKSKHKDAELLVPRESTNLSGIKNQGGTCYLNSLLQTLLFTPEFREALFSIGPEELGSLEDNSKPESKVRIIPLQLQRLFAQLLLLDQHAASTADLTDSFGWNSNEEMRQHDVQELNRILFSALETSLVGTSGHNLINQLYHGTVVNHIVCKECKNVSERQEDFLDLTVAVKDVSGLEEALWNMYVEEEHFEKDNLYRCGACNKLVEATKSAKLRKLFNFNFEKCERYKEISSYAFPVRINLKPFCEQTEVDDFKYMYELFSVIIHKGGCYGGHYHVYIRDIDELGNWQVLEESNMNDEDKDLKDIENAKEKENPLRILRNILLEEESKEIAVDRLAQKLLEKKSVSWNKKYRKQHGPIRKFLQSHYPTFLLSSDESKVKLNDHHKLHFGSTSQSNPQNHEVKMSSEKATTGLREYSSESHWFDLNDSKVQPIREQEIEKQFQGNESAYMLFYRQSQMTRPSEARGNPRYRVPIHLLNEMDAANIKLQKKRAEYDLANNSIDLHLHIFSHYKFYNGALHPVVSQKESVLDLTIDKRKTLGEIQQLVFQLLEFWEGDLVLSLAKLLPAGLHIYQTLEGDDSTLSGIGLSDGANIFVWNGKEVDGVEVLTGIDHEPVLINVLRLAGHNEGRVGQQFMESQHVFPCSSNLRAICDALMSPEGIVLKNHSGSEKDSENWKVIPEEDMKQTLRDIGLKNGSSILVLDMPEDYTVKEAELKMGSLLGLCSGKAPTATEVRQTIDWCYEAGDALSEEAATLKELNICSGDILNVAEGKLPPKYFFFKRVGNLWILCDINVDIYFENVNCIVYVSYYRPKDLLLRVQMGIPEERDYYHPVDLVWDISKECTACALRQRIASYYSLPEEQIEIAKYSPEKFEWIPICSWTQQVSKRKKKKKGDSLQLSPYNLKDGDIIGVKNLLLDDSKDFSTMKDDIGKQMQKQLAMEKTRYILVFYRIYTMPFSQQEFMCFTAHLGY
uniref:Ubiquitin carboxyl-terminal hydrolase n=1 Tax=Podarcis muralis TaxID=64176 RepID=A0A670HX43_PODMU